MNKNILYTDRRTYITKIIYFWNIPFIITEFYPEHFASFGGKDYWFDAKEPELEVIMTIKNWIKKLIN